MTSLSTVIIGATIGLFSFAGPVPDAGHKEYCFYHENVLGTSLELRVKASSLEAADRAEAAVLKEVDRLSEIFSGYSTTSEFSRWSATQGKPIAVSKELADVLRLSDEWRIRSGGGFDPRVQILSKMWAKAASEGRTPSPEEIQDALELMARPAWHLEIDEKTARRLGNSPISLNAIAKGYIVERASRKALDTESGVTGVLLNIGGDLRVAGEMSERIAVVDPNADSETSPPLEIIEVRDRAVATSGRSQRGFRIQNRWYSHILDPRTGQPAAGTAGATVIAERSADADALATILNVLTPADGLKLVETLDNIECMIVGTDGSVTKSRGWNLFQVTLPKAFSTTISTLRVDDKPWDAEHELAIDFEINAPTGNARRYRRPYVAIWVEDKDNKPVRTLTLWLSLGGSGPDRWLPDMKKWYVVNTKVKEASKIDLVHTQARATRQPGKYSVVWDGKDDKGNMLPAGDYTISIETAREHGTYQLIRKPVTLAGKPFVEELKGNVEIKSASLSYRRKAATK